MAHGTAPLQELELVAVELVSEVRSVMPPARAILNRPPPRAQPDGHRRTSFASAKGSWVYAPPRAR
jgi:hypothetical protein